MKEKTFVDTALGFAPAALIVGYVVSLYWVAELSGWLQSLHILFFVAAVYAVSALGQVRAERRMDEVELAADRFGARWGLVMGVALMVVVALLPPTEALLNLLASSFRGEGTVMRGEAPTFLLGVACTMVAQETSRFVLTAGWKWSKR